MITKRESSERGHLKLDWLNARHGFSFGSYFDPHWMGFGKLRVINEDIISPDGGFDTHGHKNMEIISFVISGSLEHKDTLGNHSIIRPGQIQVMSAGSGILHSEFNPSKSEVTHMLQIWVEPKIKNISPRYEQYNFTAIENTVVKLAGPTGGENIAKIYQDISLSLLLVTKKTFYHQLDRNKKYWIQVVNGSANINDTNVEPGDGLGITGVSDLNFSLESKIEILIFEQP